MGMVVACRGYITPLLLSLQKHLSWLCRMLFFFFLTANVLLLLLLLLLLASYPTRSFSFVFTPFLTCRFQEKWPITLPTHVYGVERNSVLFPVVTYSVTYTVFWIVIYKVLTSFTSLLLYITLQQMIWITGSLQCFRLLSKKDEVTRFVSQISYVLDGCVTCKHTIPLQTEPKTNSSNMLAGHCTSCRFVSC
jgi:hypothetical protein